jgi:hypothetical protein
LARLEDDLYIAGLHYLTFLYSGVNWDGFLWLVLNFCSR